MIAFELTMPHRGSWNNRWSQEDKRFVRVFDNKSVPKELWNRDFFYRWDDGWEACISVYQVSSSEATKLRKRSSGFCGYDWMIQSILKNGKIVLNKENENV